MSVDLIRAMLQYESQWRASETTQSLFAQDEKTNGKYEWMDRVHDFQRGPLLDKFAKSHDTEETKHKLLTAMRDACTVFPMHANEFKEIAVQFKFNRSRRGDLREGDQAPDVELAGMDGDTTTLYNIIDSSSRPVVFVAGSYT